MISAKNTPRYSLSTLNLGVRGQGAEANKSRTHSLAALPSLRMVLLLSRHGTPSHPNFPILRPQTVRGRTQSQGPQPNPSGWGPALRRPASPKLWCCDVGLQGPASSSLRCWGLALHRPASHKLWCWGLGLRGSVSSSLGC